jgi:mitochondrial fission protein ELM1
MAQPLRIWVVSDGRAGIEAQALGLAEAVAAMMSATISVKRIGWPRWMARVPSQLNLAPRTLLTARSDAIAPPWPDLWIGNGRAAIPLSIGVRRWSGGKTFVVQLQDPLRPSRLFDLVIPPNHDRLKGDNVLGIVGTPHRVTEAKLAFEAARFADRLQALPGPKIAVLIGGKSKAFNLSTRRAARLADQIADTIAKAGGSLLLTFSRRTPDGAKTVIRERLNGLPGVIWDGEGDNPYFAFLGSADVILVTEDSANMATEAAATGKPVYLLRMDGAQSRKRRFHAELAGLGIIRGFDGELESWSYAPLRETERAAAEVLRRMETIRVSREGAKARR